MGMTGKYFGKGGRGEENGGEVLCGGGASGASNWVQDVSTEPPVEEIPRGFPTPGGVANSGHWPQTSTGWEMGVYTHWGGVNNGGAVGYEGVYIPPP